MNSFLERLAALYAPMGHRGRLMDGPGRSAPGRDSPSPIATRYAPDRELSPQRRRAPVRSYNDKEFFA